jgi:hypothetical protein
MASNYEIIHSSELIGAGLVNFIEIKIIRSFDAKLKLFSK